MLINSTTRISTSCYSFLIHCTFKLEPINIEEPEIATTTSTLVSPQKKEETTFSFQEICSTEISSSVIDTSVSPRKRISPKKRSNIGDASFLLEQTPSFSCK